MQKKKKKMQATQRHAIDRPTEKIRPNGQNFTLTVLHRNITPLKLFTFIFKYTPKKYKLNKSIK